MRYLLCIFFFITLAFSSSASHLISDEITYEYLGESNYLIRVEHVDWCGGIIWSAANPVIPPYWTVGVNCKENYSQGSQLSIPLMSVVEFPVYSWAGQNLNSCGTSGSNGYTGFKIATYDTIVNLASFVGLCDTARVYIATGARNSSVNTLGQPSYYTYVDIDMVNPFENSSVKSFKFDTPAAFTDSTDYNFSLAMYDLDGDSLTYEFVPAWTNYNSTLNAINPVYYNSGYSAAQPANGLSLNPTTGQMTFATEIPAGYSYANYILNIKTSEWDALSGDLIQETFRDIQFFVLPFAGNNNPQWDDFNNITHAKQLDSLSIRVCAGDTFGFDVEFSDVDGADTLNVFSNLEFIADYYQITQTGVNPTTASIRAVINEVYDYGIDVIVKAYDTHNPMMGQASKAIHITSVGPTSETVYACYSNWDTISTQADSISIWTVLSGDTMNAQNFNCLNSACTQAELNPFNNTTYLVENYMTGNCSFTDTIVVLTDPTVLIGQALDTSQNPVTSSKVYRFQFDAGLDSVYVLDSTTTDAAGFYTFSLGADSFLLKVSPNSTTYPMLLPSYYDAQVVVSMADFVYPDYCDTLELIHEVLSGVNLGGPGFIEGIVSQGAGRAVGDPVPGVEIVLMDANEDPIEYTKTDEDGEFRFENLGNGDYYVFVDRWLIQNNIAPMITLTEEYNEVDDLEFILYSNRLELIKPKGLGEEDGISINIYPNPSDGLISVKSSSLVSSVKVTDVLGRVKYSVNPNAQQFNVNINGLSQGIYFIEMYHGDSLIGQQKIILQK